MGVQSSGQEDPGGENDNLPQQATAEILTDGRKFGAAVVHGVTNNPKGPEQASNPVIYIYIYCVCDKG